MGAGQIRGNIPEPHVSLPGGMRVRTSVPVRWICMAAAVLLSASSSLAQPAQFSESWRWSHFTTDNGLPSNYVKHLIEAADGTPWVSTRRGIAWFDGFLWHPVDSTAGLEPSEVVYLSAGNRGEVYVIQNERLYIGTTNGFVQIPIHSKEDSLGSFRTVEQDEAGNLVLDAGTGIFIVSTNGEIRPFPIPIRLSSGGGVRLFKTTSGRMFFNSPRGLFVKKGNAWESISHAPEGMYNNLRIAENKHGAGIMFGQQRGKGPALWEWGPGGRPRMHPSEGKEYIYSLDISESAESIVLHETGEIRMFVRGEWRLIDLPASHRTHIQFLHYRGNGDLWVGTTAGLELFRKSDRRWSYLRQPFPTVNNMVHALVRDKDGALWSSVPEGLIVYRPDGTSNHIDKINGRPLHNVIALCRDRSGHIWIGSGEGTFSGSYRWDGSRWEHFDASRGLNLPAIHRIVADRSGDLWFLGLSTVDYSSPIQPGAYRYANGKFEHVGKEDGMLTGRVYSFAEDLQGGRWFGESGGISRWYRGSWRHFTEVKQVYGLMAASDGKVWFASRFDGVGYIDTTLQIVRFTSTGMVSIKEAWELAEDQSGRVWVSTESGLGCYNHGVWSLIGIQEGLGGFKLWGLLLEDRSLVIATRGSGISILNLDDCATPNPRVQVAPPVTSGSEIVFSWTASSYWGTIASPQLETRYRLDDEPWSPWSKESSARFPAVRPGAHRLTVQAKGLYGSFDEAGGSRDFTVEPPFLLRPLVLLVLLISAAIVATILSMLLVRKRRVDRALRESEGRYRGLVSRLPDIIVIHRNGVIEYVNDVIKTVLGYEPGRMVGKDVFTIIHPDDRMRLREYQARRSRNMDAPRDFFARGTTHDGEIRLFQVRVTLLDLPHANLTLVVLTDITERTRIQEQLLKERREQQMILDASPITIWFKNLENRYLRVNRAAAGFLNREAGEIEGKTAYEIFGSQAADFIADDARIAETGEPQTGKLERLQIGDEVKWLRIDRIPWRDEAGEIAGVIAFGRDVTEEIRFQEALRESELRFQSLAEVSPVGIFKTDLEGRFLYTNKKAADIAGRTVAEAIDKPWWMLLPETDRETVQAIIDRWRGSQAPLVLEHRFPRPDGTTVWALIQLIRERGVNANAEGDGYIGTITDITALKRAEEELRKLSYALEQSPVSIMITDTDGRIEYVNPRFELVTGYTQEEVRGRNPRFLKSGDTTPEEYRSLWETIRHGGEWRGEFHNRKKSGELFWELASISPIRSSQGDVTHYLAVREDITERKSMQEQLFRAQKLESLGTLAGGIAHDFNNVLAMIQTAVEMIAMKAKNDPQLKRYADMVLNATERGASIARQLLLFARSDIGEMKSVALSSVVEEAVHLLEHTIPKSIVLRTLFECADDTVFGDQNHLHQVVMNIAINARDAMPRGGSITFSVQRTGLVKAGGGRDPYVVLAITDTGTGMDEETKQRIFDPFFTTKERGKGTGLGLSIVHGIMERHGGFVDVQTKLGAGTTFSLYFPAVQTKALLEQRENGSLEYHGQGTVLVVDDEPMLVETLSDFLEQHGHPTLKAYNGASALKLFAARKAEIVLVITDLGMPLMDGVELARQLRGVRPDIKIAVTTGYFEDEEGLQAARPLFNGFLSKPYRFDAIARMLDEILTSQ